MLQERYYKFRPSSDAESSEEKGRMQNVCVQLFFLCAYACRDAKEMVFIHRLN